MRPSVSIKKNLALQGLPVHPVPLHRSPPSTHITHSRRLLPPGLLLLVRDEGEPRVPDERDKVGKEDLVVLGHEPEVHQLAGHPDLPVQEQGVPPPRLEARHDLRGLAL